MKIITTKLQLVNNIETVENYLTDGNDYEQSTVRSLIRKGKCLMAYEVSNEIRFAPSRFLGYINNELRKHESSHSDGRTTNSAISRATGSKPIPSTKLEEKYISYCEGLGIVPSNYSKRRYWHILLAKDFEENTVLDGQFAEGKIVERIHKSRERSSKATSLAKRNFKAKNKGRLFCEACKFDFEKKYGHLGEDFIEAHHTVPVSKMGVGHTTSPADFVMLCSNCHRMIHRDKDRPWLTIKELKLLIK